MEELKIHPACTRGAANVATPVVRIVKLLLKIAMSDDADSSEQTAPIHTNPRLIVSYCPYCGAFIAASPHPELLLLAWRFHECAGSLTFGAPV